MKTEKAAWAKKAVHVALAAALAAGAAQAQAAIDSFLKITGMPGESTDASHKDEIEVTSFSYSLDSRNCQFSFVKFLDKASPALSEAAAKKSSIGAVTFTARKAGEGQKDYFSLAMTNVNVQSLDLAASSGAPTPSEEVVLSPRSVTVSYKPQDPKGGYGPAVVTTFNCDR